MLPLKELLSNYFSSHQAIPAFNIDSFEIYQAVEAAVIETKLPAIVQLSQNEDKFISAEKLYLLVKKANLEGLPIYLNMDHGHDIKRLTDLSRLGFDMVHFDGSPHPYTENLSKSIDFAKTIHPRSLVELEFDQIDSAGFTDPQNALDFITQTGADLLAVSLGSRHGNDPLVVETIDLDLLSQIHSLLPTTFLVLHGSSGVALTQIQSAVKLGIVKINVNTDLRLSFLGSLRRELSTNKSEKIYDYFIPAIDGLKKIVIDKLTSFTAP